MSAPATATKVRDVTGWAGDAALYKLDPPLEHGAFVIASAVDLHASLAALDSILGNSYRSSETMVFPATPDGEAINWGELGFAPRKSHAEALENMGYRVSP